MKRIFLASLMAIAFIAPSYAAISNDDIQKAAQMYCNSLKSGQSKEEAAKAADDYLTAKVNKGETVSFGEIRKQMRQSILNICPDLVKK
jgi:hypothetical protein